MSVARVANPLERRLADRDHTIVELVAQTVSTAEISPTHEAELRQLAAERHRRVADLTEQAAICAAALEREERAADEHVQLCMWCLRWRRHPGVCWGFRRISRGIDRLHREYRRAVRRLENDR